MTWKSWRIILIFLLCLHVAGGMMMAQDGTDAAETPVRPWNGFWWPNRYAAMISGAATLRLDPPLSYWPDWDGFFSPFEKYAQAVGENSRGNLYTWEYNHHYNPQAESWEGHCNGWAAAAVIEPEPREPGEMESVFFRIGDKKALLTEMHQADPFFKLFDSNTDDAAMFHEVLVQYVKTLGKPLIVEIDPGREVWNYPCYKYEMSWSDEGNRRHVALTIYLAMDNESPDSTSLNSTPVSYTYDLILDGDTIVGGEWTGDSISFHPQYLWFPTDRHAANPFLEWDHVSSIVGTSVSDTLTDDNLENNNTLETARSLPQDVFFGRLLDDDFLGLGVEAGENLSVSVYANKIDGELDCSLLDDAGAALEDPVIDSNRLQFNVGVSPVDQNLILDLHPRSPQTNHRNYGVEIIREGPVFYMPHVVDADGWSTQVFLTNPASSATPLYFHLYRTTNGTTEKLHYTSLLPELPGNGMVFASLDNLFSDLEPDNERWLKIRSGGQITGAFLFENYQGAANLASMPLQDHGSRTLYFNHLAADDLWWTGVSIANCDAFHPVTVNLQPVSPGGEELAETVTLTIDGGGRYINMLAGMFTADTLSRAGWIRIDADREVTGFEMFGTNDLGLFEGIPLQDRVSTHWVASWIPQSTDWWAGVSIVNPSDSRDAKLVITPYTRTGKNAFGLLNPVTYEVTLAPGEKFVRLVGQLFPDPSAGPIAYLDIESTQPVTGFVLYGDGAMTLMNGYPLLDEADLASAGVFPQLEGSRLLINNSLSSNSMTLTLTAIGEDGLSLAISDPLSVPVKAAKALGPDDFFPSGVPAGTRFFSWTASRDVLVQDEIVQDGRGTLLQIPPVSSSDR